ncbi:hypothetical protein C0Q70_10600 [Pomacea canaliculata]|uniref:ENTH domain-containing protein n=1 Tax=Pomacea canaliculata TaxID=400727 RepID=A0A2T7P3M8_POMCA|nr:hypothetical protein C0Q70_10600 [Pomacea canaliculata]
MSGQSIMDRVAAAKHSIAGQGLAKSVCKATTEEIIGPKKKHLDYLLQCTNEPNVSIPQLADLLIERTQHSSWVVVFKALITTHNLMNYGNERFTQYLASNNCSFNLSGFVDKGGVQGYDMSTFIRRYAKYLNEKAVSYRQMAFDFCKVKRGSDDGLLRTMNAEKLLKTLPILQQQLDSLLEFDCTPNELTNGVINACFLLLFKDLIRLFACYNDGIINLLEKYFDMNKKQCREGLELYKKFLVRMEKVSEFLKVAENVGIDKGDIPDLAKAPASLLEALEQHLASLEGKKGTGAAPTSAAKPAGFSSALSTMSTNSTALDISETEKKKILEEESQRLQQLKGLDMEPASTEADLLEATELDETNFVSNHAKPSDDLLGLSTNPFTQNIQSVMASAYTATPASSNPFGASPFEQTNGFAATGTGNFTSDADFARAFSSSTTASAGLNFGTATVSSISSAPPGLSDLQIPGSPGFDAFGDVLQPTKQGGMIQPTGSNKTATEAKLLATDLDTSLASLASNLSVKSSSNQIKKTDHQWQPKGESKLTGGASFQQRPMIASTTTWTTPQYQPPMMGMTGVGFSQPQMMPIAAQPMMGVGQPMPVAPGMGMMPSMGMPQPLMYGGARMPVTGSFPQTQPRPQNPPQNDPFGAL